MFALPQINNRNVSDRVEGNQCFSGLQTFRKFAGICKSSLTYLIFSALFVCKIANQSRYRERAANICNGVRKIQRRPAFRKHFIYTGFTIPLSVLYTYLSDSILLRCFPGRLRGIRRFLRGKRNSAFIQKTVRSVRIFFHFFERPDLLWMSPTFPHAGQQRRLPPN